MKTNIQHADDGRVQIISRGQPIVTVDADQEAAAIAAVHAVEEVDPYTPNRWAVRLARAQAAVTKAIERTTP